MFYYGSNGSIMLGDFSLYILYLYGLIRGSKELTGALKGSKGLMGHTLK